MVNETPGTGFPPGIARACAKQVCAMKLILRIQYIFLNIDKLLLKSRLLANNLELRVIMASECLVEPLFLLNQVNSKLSESLHAILVFVGRKKRQNKTPNVM